MTRMLLVEENGFVLTVVEDDQAALAALKAVSANLIIVDWEPEHGREPLQLLRGAAAGIPIILITSGPMPNDRRIENSTVLAYSEVGTLLLPMIRLVLGPGKAAESRRRLDKIPLGIGDAYVAAGQHLSLLSENEADLQACAGFFVAGISAGDNFLLAGPQSVNELMLRIIHEHGLDVESLRSGGRLSILKAENAGDKAGALTVAQAIQAASGRGAPLLRVVGTVSGWKQPEDESAVIAAEAILDRAVHDSFCICLCPYRIDALSGGIMFKSALQNHSHFIYRNSITASPFYSLKG
jgi:hypothetical protein